MSALVGGVEMEERIAGRDLLIAVRIDVGLAIDCLDADAGCESLQLLIQGAR
jgi:hypothetical protein